MSGTSRFRFRDKSGEEQEVPSVEELSRHIEKGDLDLDTSLYDAGTGQWSRAGNVPVFQFIVDELQREGRLPAGFGSVAEPPRRKATDDPFEVETLADAEPTEGDESPLRDEPSPAHEDLPLTPDPFEMHLPRTARSEADLEADEDGPDNRPLSEWLMDRPGDEEKSEDVAEEVAGEASPSATSDRPARPPKSDPWGRPNLRGLQGIESPVDDSATLDPDEDRPDATPASGWERATEAVEKGGAPAGGIRSRPPPKRKDGLGRTTERRGARHRAMVIGLMAGGVVILSVAMLMLTAEGDRTPDPFAGPAGSPSGNDAELMLPPFPTPTESATIAREASSDLAAEAPGAMEELVMVELEALLDSIRAEHGVTVVPPAGWLGGAYLSGASGFHEVTDFWDGYESLIRQFGEEDRDLYIEAARRAWFAVLDDSAAGDAEGLAGFLEAVSERYETVGPIRAERYERRIRVAGAARELHTFLLRAENRIDHDPALGRTLSRDPILEAVPRDPETRSEMDRHLDRLFNALDQTRRGVPPALGGLRTELFHRLREPV